jgi:transposase, IS5 family
MLKARHLSLLYELSDVKLVNALDDRASFHPFCGFLGPEATPKQTAFVCFCKGLIVHCSLQWLGS